VPASNQSKNIKRRVAGNNVWLEHSSFGGEEFLVSPVKEFQPEVLKSEEAIGEALFEELKAVAEAKTGDVTLVLLGGRGAQAMYRLINEKAGTTEIDDLLARLHVFTQDALAPMRMNNGLSFVRDFERLLGENFFGKIKSFTPMQTETDDVEGELIGYIEKLESLGGIDLFYLGFGPEAESASHLCYIKPGSGARAGDFAGIIPISKSILEHHINKFKVGGSAVSSMDETECRAATDILTLGPAAILNAKRIVQSIVDAGTAPAKKGSYKRFLETEISLNRETRAAQMDENPGLWLRLHPNVRSLILPDVLES
jgi:6-phosphogluconolactonase/glucosamine-6-phosphate isomerase/deaminase